MPILVVQRVDEYLLERFKKTVNDLLCNLDRIFYCLQVRRINTNSSPPKRAMVSPFLRAACNRSDVALRIRSPLWWPRVSFTSLKLSRSSIATPTFFWFLRAWAKAISKRSERVSGGKTSQKIMISHVLNRYFRFPISDHAGIKWARLSILQERQLRNGWLTYS